MRPALCLFALLKGGLLRRCLAMTGSSLLPFVAFAFPVCVRDMLVTTRTAIRVGARRVALRNSLNYFGLSSVGARSRASSFVRPSPLSDPA